MKKIITFLLACFFTVSLQAQSVIRGPYLQQGSATSIIVQWRTDTPTNSKVWIGTELNNLGNSTSVNGNVSDHQVLITDLTPDTKYYYSVGFDNTQITGANENHFFITAPVVGTEVPVRAWVLGDCGTGSTNQENVRNGYLDYVGNGKTDMILLLGDNAYWDGADDAYQIAIFEMYDALLPQVPVYSCPGNHDYYTADFNNESGPYYDIFNFPKNAELGGVASGTEAYYSFDYANMHIISLDSDRAGKNIGDPMLVWLENDLNATSQDWTIVLFHHPPYTKGSHDSDDGGHHKKMRENVLPILEAGGVDLVLSGHSHSYERSYLIKGHFGESTTLEPQMILDNGDGRTTGNGAYGKLLEGPTAGDGSVYIVAGSSGKKANGTLDHPVMYYSESELGSLSLELQGNELNLKFINDQGTIKDYFTIVKTGLPTGTPPEVIITAPQSSDNYTFGESILIATNPTDEDGTIAKVEFYVNNTYLETVYEAPFEIEYTPEQTGPVIFTTKATDNVGFVAYSDPLTLTIGDLVSVVTPTSCPDNIVVQCEANAGVIVNWVEPEFETNCTSVPSSQCNDISIDDATLIGELNNHFYFISDNALEWEDAQIFSEANGGYLAVITSQEENDYIQSLLTKNVWIGYHDMNTENQFEWVTGETSSYENWGSWQPNVNNGDSEDIVQMKPSDGKWYDKTSYRDRFIIEVPCSNISTSGGEVYITQTTGLTNGSFFPEGISTIYYEATDDCGSIGTCSFDINVLPCQLPCSISATTTNIQCFDNGTPEDGSDDTYTFDLLVDGTNASSDWTMNGFTGSYGVTQTIGPIPSLGNTANWVISDAEDLSCTISIAVQIPNCVVLPPACSITAFAENIQCSDNGTPDDALDDTYTFDLLVDGANGSASWIMDGASGTYGAQQTIGPILSESSPTSWIIADQQDTTCNTTLDIVIPSCVATPPPCFIAAVVKDLQCDDNGTPTNGSDDTYTFELTVDALNASTGWTMDSFSGNYGAPIVVGPFPSSGASAFFEIVDQEDPDCIRLIEILIPSCEVIIPIICEEEDISGFSYLGAGDTTVYYLSDSKSKWSDANMICESLGGYLAKIESAEENEMVFNMLSGFNNFALIGFNDEMDEGNFVWSDNTPVEYINIEVIEDNNTSDNFGNINPWSGTWAVVNEWVSKPFILEKPCPTSIAGLSGNNETGAIAQGDLRKSITDKNKKRADQSIQIFPNPVGDKLSLYFDSKPNEHSAILRIVKTDGTQIINERRLLNDTNNNWELAVGDLGKGVYSVQIIMNETILEGRFVKM